MISYTPGNDMFCPARLVAVVGWVTTIRGPGGLRGTSSSGPGPTPMVGPPAPGAVRLGAISMVQRTVEMTWTPSAGATAYVVEIGSTPGASEVATTTVTAPSFLWRDARIGQSFVRVKAQNAEGTSGASVETPSSFQIGATMSKGSSWGRDPCERPKPMTIAPSASSESSDHGRVCERDDRRQQDLNRDRSPMA